MSRHLVCCGLTEGHLSDLRHFYADTPISVNDAPTMEDMESANALWIVDLKMRTCFETTLRRSLLTPLISVQALLWSSYNDAEPLPEAYEWQPYFNEFVESYSFPLQGHIEHALACRHCFRWQGRFENFSSEEQEHLSRCKTCSSLVTESAEMARRMASFYSDSADLAVCPV